jgi:cephalosporin hydroxylase
MTTLSFQDSLKTFIKNVGDSYFWSFSKSELYNLLSRYHGNSPSEILSITKEYQGKGWYKRLSAYQIDYEFEQLILWATKQQPKIILEIGTAQGATLLAWCRIASELVISVDLEGGIHGGGYPPQKQRLYRELVHDRNGVNLALLQASSQDIKTRQKVEEILNGRSLDILFIDGDHRLEGVKRDFELWSPLVKPNGYVVFHDIVPHRKVKDCEVDVLWNELKDKYPSQEIIADSDEGWGGIGILAL